MNGWMWRPAEVEAINRQAPRAKGGVEPVPEWAGPVSPGRSAQAHFGLAASISSLVASCMIPYLCALACGPLTLFPS
jgi:hypothetical protein